MPGQMKAGGWPFTARTGTIYTALKKKQNEFVREIKEQCVICFLLVRVFQQCNSNRTEAIGKLQRTTAAV